MMKRFCKIRPVSGRRLLAFCYTAFLAVSLLCGTVGFAADRIGRMTGSIAEQSLPVDAFSLVNMEKSEGENLWHSTTDDPRMVLENPPERVARVDMTVRYLTVDPGEFTLFYMPRPGMEEFDANYRLWAEQKDTTHWSFSLPTGKVHGLRIDPGIYGGMEMEITDITLNAKQSAASFFVPGRAWLVSFLVFPALIASAADTIIAFFTAPRRGEGTENMEGK